MAGEIMKVDMVDQTTGSFLIGGKVYPLSDNAKKYIGRAVQGDMTVSIVNGIVTFFSAGPSTTGASGSNYKSDGKLNYADVVKENSPKISRQACINSAIKLVEIMVEKGALQKGIKHKSEDYKGSRMLMQTIKMAQKLEEYVNTGQMPNMGSVLTIAEKQQAGMDIKPNEIPTEEIPNENIVM